MHWNNFFFFLLLIRKNNVFHLWPFHISGHVGQMLLYILHRVLYVIILSELEEAKDETN